MPIWVLDSIMSTRFATIVVFLSLSLAWLSNVAAREWTDVTGQYRVEAELIDFTDGVVRLRKEDGTEIAVPSPVPSIDESPAKTSNG